MGLSLGWLGERGQDAFIGTAGPILVLGRTRLPLSFELDVSPTILSSDHFEGLDFGMRLQFTTALGLNWDFARHWRLGYRAQHMSNGGLATPNLGLNMHIFSLSYVF